MVVCFRLDLQGGQFAVRVELCAIHVGHDGGVTPGFGIADEAGVDWDGGEGVGVLAGVLLEEGADRGDEPDGESAAVWEGYGGSVGVRGGVVGGGGEGV